MKQHMKAAFRRAGVEITRVRPQARDLPLDFDAVTRRIVEQVRVATMTSPERISAVIEAMRYVDRCGIPGAFVECGVWKGGSSMAAALAHTESGEPTRPFYLYDTFEGMPPPTADDVELNGRSATDAMADEKRDSSHVWAVAALDLVKENMQSTGYPERLVTYVEGKVEDSIPNTLPGQIAVLRLDTDWYESTRHELAHLVPLVAANGVLIIDDYGHWQGARKAVDEWLAAATRPILLNRTDYTGRIAVLPQSASE